MKAAQFLFQGEDEYIMRYPKKDVIKILKGTGYHSEEWEITDDDNDDDYEGTIFTNYIIVIFIIKLIY